MGRTLGIIGTGAVGSTIARLAVAAGWHVVVSNSRGPETLGDLVTELGDHAEASTVAEAAARGDIVVAAVPLIAHTELPRDALAGKIVIDTTNYTVERDGHLDELDSDELTSSELVQRHLAGASVVKAFNNITTPHLAALGRPSGSPERSALPVTGNDRNAKERVAALLDDLGYDTVDLGSLAESWRFSPNTPLYALIYGGEPIPAGLSGIEVLQWFTGLPGGQVTAGQIREVAAATTRAPAALALG